MKEAVMKIIDTRGLPWGLPEVGGTLYIYLKYIWFILIWFYATSTIVGYLMPNPLYTCIWFGLAWFYGRSTIVGYLILNHVYTFISNIYDLSTHFIDNVIKWP